MAKKQLEDNVPGEPPMTPMIDVIFQLLIFFMVTLKFSAAEGKILSQLPKDKGLGPSDVTNPEINEVKVFLCAEGEAGLKMHAQNKGNHDNEKNKNLRKDVAVLMVESQIIGTVHSSALPDGKFDAAKANKNIQYYDLAAKQAFQIWSALPSSQDPTKKAPVKIDPDSEVPYEHVIGVIGALKKYGVDNIEYEGNPRLARYFGDMLKAAQTGQ